MVYSMDESEKIFNAFKAAIAFNPYKTEKTPYSDRYVAWNRGVMDALRCRACTENNESYVKGYRYITTNNKSA